MTQKITVNESQDGKVHAILGRHKRKIEVSFRIGQNYMNVEDHTFKKSKMTPVRVDINDNLNAHELVQLINGLTDIHNGRLNPVIIGSEEPTFFYLSTRTGVKSARNGTTNKSGIDERHGTTLIKMRTSIRDNANRFVCQRQDDIPRYIMAGSWYLFDCLNNAIQSLQNGSSLGRCERQMGVNPPLSFYLSTRTDLTSARNGERQNRVEGLSRIHTRRLGSNSRVHKRATRSQDETTKSSDICCNNAKQDKLSSILCTTRQVQGYNGIHTVCYVGITGDLSPSLFLSSCIKRAGVGGEC